MVRRLTRDLAVEIEVRALPTVRDADGLALSSRNVLLSPRSARGRSRFTALATRSVEQARALLSENGLAVDYVEAAEFDPPVLAGAVRVGSTRLIDNVPLEGDEREHPSAARSGDPGAREAPLTELPEMKARRQPIVMVTAYDAWAGGSRTRRAQTSSSSATRRR